MPALMTQPWTIILQGAAMFCQMVVLTMPVISAEWKPAIIGLISFLQAFQGILASRSPQTTITGQVVLPAAVDKILTEQQRLVVGLPSAKA